MSTLSAAAKVRRWISLLFFVATMMVGSAAAFSIHPLHYPDNKSCVSEMQERFGQTLRVQLPKSRGTIPRSVMTPLALCNSHMPELGEDGLYHIENEEQHKAFLAANKDQLVVVKLFAPWCRTCKGLRPKFLAIVRDPNYATLPIVWADFTIKNNKKYIQQLGLSKIPTIQFYSNGELHKVFSCGASKVAMLKQNLAQFVKDKIDPTTNTVKSSNNATPQTVPLQLSVPSLQYEDTVINLKTNNSQEIKLPQKVSLTLSVASQNHDAIVDLEKETPEIIMEGVKFYLTINVPRMTR